MMTADKIYEFSAKDSESDQIIKYRIQSLPEELYEDALQLYYEEFFPEEFMYSSKKLHEKDFKTNEMIEIIRKTLKKGLSIACFRNDGKYENEIVAAQALYVRSKNDKTDLSQVN